MSEDWQSARIGPPEGLYGARANSRTISKPFLTEMEELRIKAIGQVVRVMQVPPPRPGGCKIYFRLHPDDTAKLFPLVPDGAFVNFCEHQIELLSRGEQVN